MCYSAFHYIPLYFLVRISSYQIYAGKNFFKNEAIMKTAYYAHEQTTENGCIRAEVGVKVPGKSGFQTATGDLSIECDANGIFTFSSPSFRRMLGYDYFELLGKPVFEYVHPDDVHAVLIAFDISIKTGMPCHAKFRFRKASGEYVWLESNCSAAPNKNLTAHFQLLDMTNQDNLRVSQSPH